MTSEVARIPVNTKLVLTCEHASNAVPRRYRALFTSRSAQRALASHEGSDLGARSLARSLAKHFGAELFEGTVSRLLVDLNRSLGHRQLFSPFAQELPEGERERLLTHYYRPFRDRVLAATVEGEKRGQRVIHVSVHSFTPVLNGQRRRADVGLLYDPRRSIERALCHCWRSQITAASCVLTVRRNYPYRGVADGHTSALRQRFPEYAYVGIELELNQALRAGSGQFPQPLIHSLAASLQSCLDLR